MQSKILAKHAVQITVISGLALYAAFFSYLFPEKPIPGGTAALLNQEQEANQVQEVSQIQEPVELPMRLKIPAIDVDAVVIPLGVTSEGVMDVPKTPYETAWFNLGPRPGEIGAAVIAGHYGWKNNIPAAFDDLHKLRVGDRVMVEDEQGVSISFIVRDTRVYGKDEAAPGVFSSNDDTAHLNLVTCMGAWDDIEKSRSDRLVVFTEREN